MVNPDLKYQIRAEIAEEEVKGQLALMNNPATKDIMNLFSKVLQSSPTMKAAANDVIGSLAMSEKISPKTVDELVSQGLKEHQRKMQEVMSNPDEFRKFSYEKELAKLFTEEEVLKGCIRTVDEVRELTLERFSERRPHAEAGILKAYYCLMPRARYNDKFLTELATIADVSGIPFAIKQETKDSVIRKIFPLSDYYANHEVDCINIENEYLKTLSGALLQLGPDAIPILAKDPYVQNVSRPIVELVKMQIRNDIDRIYNLKVKSP